MSKHSKNPKWLQKNGDVTERLKIIKVDPFGSYTGRPLDGEEVPVQDADDL